MGFSRQQYWTGLPWAPPEDLPHPGIKSTSFTSPALAGGFFTICTSWEAPSCMHGHNCTRFATTTTATQNASISPNTPSCPLLLIPQTQPHGALICFLHYSLHSYIFIYMTLFCESLGSFLIQQIVFRPCTVPHASVFFPSHCCVPTSCVQTTHPLSAPFPLRGAHGHCCYEHPHSSSPSPGQTLSWMGGGGDAFVTPSWPHCSAFPPAACMFWRPHLRSTRGALCGFRWTL